MTTPNAILASLKQLHDTGSSSDFTIISSTTTHKVHRAIITSQDGFFAGAANDDFREGRENTIDLSADDPALVKAVVEYLYGIQYTVDKEAGSGVPRADVRVRGLPPVASSATAACRGFRGGVQGGERCQVVPSCASRRRSKVYGGTKKEDRGLRNALVGIVEAQFHDVVGSDKAELDILEQVSLAG